MLHFAYGPPIEAQEVQTTGFLPFESIGRHYTANGANAESVERLDGPSEPAQQVNDWSEELVRQGGFGTRSIFVDERLFFGNDRIPLVDWMLGPISDENFVMPGQHG